MLRNYFTLYHAARELHEEVTGGYLFEIHSQEKSEVTLSFVTGDGRHLQLILVTRSPAFSISTREGLNRKRRNSASLMGSLYETMVTGVSMAPSDREILFNLESGDHLILRFFGANTNLLHVRDGRIIDAFKERQALAGREYAVQECRHGTLRRLEELAGDESRFCGLLEDGPPEATLQERLSEVLSGFDRHLVREVSARAGETGNPAALYQAFCEIFYELIAPSPTVVETKGEKPTFTLLPQHNDSAIPFKRVLDGLNRYSVSMRRFLALHAAASALTREIELRLHRIGRELSDYDPGTLEGSADRYETFGHLLTAVIGRDLPSSGFMTVENFFEPENPQTAIPLTAGLNIQQNAASYFSKAAKARGRLEAMQERHDALLQEQALLLQLQQEASDISSPEELKTWLGSHAALLQLAESGRNSGKRTRKRFKSIELSKGVTLYIGSNAKNNEELTFGFARPDDIWLHARGAAGAHCVLKGSGIQQTSDIRRAAEIAAWYSSAKHSGLVPVIYTQKKYVRKEKSGTPGSVIVEREHVILVRPLKE
jgi:predicted ribosome quality control (RQC) complex YloA/Tae2 family protein